MPVYTVEQVVQGALRHPKDWDGRLVQVRAIASESVMTTFQGGAQRTQSAPQILLSAAPDRRASMVGVSGMIYVLPGREDGVLALLRRLPFVGAAMPRPQRISLTQASTYQLRVHLAAHDCNFSPCIAAVLIDAAPQAHTIWAVDPSL